MPISESLPPRVLFLESVQEILAERLQAAGFICDHRYSATRENILEDIEQYTGIIVRSRITLDETFLSAAHRLRFIARSGSGLENIDTDYAKRKGIEVFNSPEGNRDAVGEHALGMLLTLFNRLHLADPQVRQGLWLREENRGIELAGKTVALIGYGQMGSAFAKKLSGMDCKVIAYDKYLAELPDQFARKVDMTAMRQQADVVSIHLPLTEETAYFADRTFFASFSKPIWLINTSRGKHVKTDHLAAAIKNGLVRGACLDVLEYEKTSLEGLELNEYPEGLRYLMSSDRVLLSPHIAGWTQESYVKLSSVLADKILLWWANGQPKKSRLV
jgi:D-3-phosphoglycerate dehydrogenase / 2-oxoglutarate reductase